MAEEKNFEWYRRKIESGKPDDWIELSEFFRQNENLYRAYSNAYRSEQERKRFYNFMGRR